MMREFLIGAASRLRQPASVVLLIGLAGFLIDVVVQRISTAGVVLLLLAASPFLLRLVRPDQLNRRRESPARDAAAATRAPGAGAATSVAERPAPSPRDEGRLPRKDDPKPAEPRTADVPPAMPSPRPRSAQHVRRADAPERGSAAPQQRVQAPRLQPASERVQIHPRSGEQGESDERHQVTNADLLL